MQSIIKSNCGMLYWQGGAAYVFAALRARREHTRAFDADEHPYGDQHGAFHLCETLASERDRGQANEQHERYQLGDGSDRIENRGIGRAPGNEPAPAGLSVRAAPADRCCRGAIYRDYW